MALQARVEAHFADAGATVEQLLTILEDAELTFEGEPLTPLLYGVFLMGYYARNDLNSARFLWKRTPQECKDDAQLRQVWEIGKFLWARRYEEMFGFLEGAGAPVVHPNRVHAGAVAEASDHGSCRVLPAHQGGARRFYRSASEP